SRVGAGSVARTRTLSAAPDLGVALPSNQLHGSAVAPAPAMTSSACGRRRRGAIAGDAATGAGSVARAMPFAARGASRTDLTHPGHAAAAVGASVMIDARIHETSLKPAVPRQRDVVLIGRPRRQFSNFTLRQRRPMSSDTSMAAPTVVTGRM